MKFYFITGSQGLYGEETLREVASDTRTIVAALNESPIIPYEIEWKNTVVSPEAILDVISEANYDKECAGIITFMHTFSPSKMWIAGLSRLQKPYCHFHTQFNREIPWETIDMDFMNLNQSAHGDREHGFIGARMRMPRKIVVGYWQDEKTQEKLAAFMRAAAGAFESARLKIARFGDNMREVAVTEGDKVGVQIEMGWATNGYGIGDLCDLMDGVSDAEVNEAYDRMIGGYNLLTSNIEAVKYQVKIELALRKFLADGGFGAFTTCFQDLHGMKQLPGMACQRLMEDGYGFGAEGDWKDAALCRIMKVMSRGKAGGTSFMEDYTYNLVPGNECVLGAHMLEVCPSIADKSKKPNIVVKPLSIGNREDPARITFDGAAGDAINVTVVDVGGRLRMIVQDIEAISPLHPMPNLPVAATMWKPLPDIETASGSWITAGGAHHFVLSHALRADDMRDYAEMMGIEFVHIGRETDIVTLKNELRWNDAAFRLGIK